MFRGESDQSVDMPAGDVVVVLDVAPHPRFKRKGNDLICTLELSLVEALCGFTRHITHLDGRVLRVTHPPGEVLKLGDFRAIIGEGMPQYRSPFEKGNLVVIFKVAFPERIDPAVMPALEAVLPAREPLPALPDDAETEDCELRDIDIEEASQRQDTGNAYDEDDGPERTGIPCAQQ